MPLSDEGKKKVDAVEEAVNAQKPVEKPQPLRQNRNIEREKPVRGLSGDVVISVEQTKEEEQPDRNIEREKPVRGLSGLIAPLPGAGLCKLLKKLLKK